MAKPSKTGTMETLLALVVLSGGFVLLGIFNPAMPEYQSRVLTAAAEERRSPSDAVLSSILQSISLPGRARLSEERPSPVTLLVNRTTRSNYVVFSVYSTEFDYCDGSSARAIGRTLAIAGRFYTIEKGACPSNQRG